MEQMKPADALASFSVQIHQGLRPDFFDVIVSVVSCFASWAPPSQNQTKQREREHILFQSTIA